MRGRNVVYVIAKAPGLRTSKTRLTPPLPPIEAVGLARAFLLDSVEIVRRAAIPVRVMCRSEAERSLLGSLLGKRAEVSVQGGRGLGSALESAFTEGLAAGYSSVGVFGADSPTLDPQVLITGLNMLDDGADVALGPSVDGGYYFLGAREVHTRLFHGMPWGTASVAELTLRYCDIDSLEVRLLPQWYDVDDWAGLVQLREELKDAGLDVARHTRRALTGADLGAIPARQTSLVAAPIASGSTA